VIGIGGYLTLTDFRWWFMSRQVLACLHKWPNKETRLVNENIMSHTHVW